MAAPKKPRGGSKASSARSSGGKKPAAKKTTKSTGARKAPTKRAGSAPAKPAGKAAAKPPAAGKTAVIAKAESTTPSLRPGGRRGGIGRWIAVGALLAGVVVVIVLIASSGSDNSSSTVADTNATASTPTATATTSTRPAVTTPAAVTPAGKPVVRTQSCPPIIGTGTVNGGKSYDVTSSATDGDPAGCGEAHSVLLSALSGQASTVGDWTCRTDPSAATVASCTSSGGRTILARG
ncbi:MAG: hypothetical protein QOD14_1186 [Solirubrobacterales bacterium]|nr:hypothetical protein [Solirubrobacterales bacterium]